MFIADPECAAWTDVLSRPVCICVSPLGCCAEGYLLLCDFCSPARFVTCIRPTCREVKQHANRDTTNKVPTAAGCRRSQAASTASADLGDSQLKSEHPFQRNKQRKNTLSLFCQLPVQTQPTAVPPKSSHAFTSTPASTNSFTRAVAFFLQSQEAAEVVSALDESCLSDTSSESLFAASTTYCSQQQHARRSPVGQTGRCAAVGCCQHNSGASDHQQLAVLRR
jgi:hypothetical protein